jgi:hypothetical protein
VSRDADVCAEDQDRLADANLIAELERVGVVHAHAVDVRAVRRAEVFENPFPAAREQLGVSARTSVVGQRKLATFTPDERRRIRQLESSAFVRPLHDEKGEHGRCIIRDAGGESEWKLNPKPETRNPKE